MPDREVAARFQEAQFLDSKSAPVAGACDPAANTATVQPSPPCTRSQVQGLSGTGYALPDTFYTRFISLKMS